MRVLAGRLAQSLAVLFVVLTLSFFVMKLAPGSPLSKDRELPPAVEAMLEERYGLNKPLHQQYLDYLGQLARLDLGPSIKQEAPVTEILGQALPYSLLLGFQAMFLALLLGIPMGVAAAWRPGSWWDHATMGISMLGISIPNFVLGPLLISTISLGLGLTRSGGWSGWADSILPSISLAIFYMSYVSRLTRSGMLEVARLDFVRTARAKGLAERTVMLRHVLRAGILPVVSFLGPALAAVLTGSVVVERVFNVPGIGAFFVDAAFNRDYFLVLGAILVYSILLVGLNLAVDLLYAWVDPRISLKDGA
jgi:oligopeptide transport system permease protein